VPLAAVAAALVSALIHASWNALLKSGRDRLADSFLVAVGCALFALPMIALTGAPPRAALPFLATSAFVHSLYWACLIKGYDAGDLSHVYTLSRGCAPVLVAIGAAFAAREVPSAGDATGIALVSVGVLSVGFSPHAPLRATMWALATAACIATYSIVDALGARAAANPFVYIAWNSLLLALPLACFAMARRGARLIADARGDVWRGLAAGAISCAGFGIVLWAQTFAPIAEVTALRETSVVFAALLSWLVLKEPMGPRRWLGALVVATGALLIGFS
jgi:drug/metabolite transporter (DMT)-like permease